MKRGRVRLPWILGGGLVLLILVGVILAVSNSNSRPAPRGNWGEGVHVSAVDPTGDCDDDDLPAGDEDCSDKHYVEAFGYAGVTSKADYSRKYGFYQSSEYKQKAKVKKHQSPSTKSKSSKSPKPSTSPTRRW